MPNTVKNQPLLAKAVSQALAYTHFPDLHNTQGQKLTATWADICTMIENAPTYVTKAAQPLLKLATFDSGSRSKALEAVYGLEIDYDAGKVPMTDAAWLIRNEGILAKLYTSYTATPDLHKWRILAPLSASVSPGDRAAWVAALDGVIGGIAARESYTPKQIYFFGRNPDRYQTISVDGQPLDTIPAMQQAANAYRDSLQAAQEDREVAALQAAQARIQSRDQRAGRALVGGQLSVIAAFNKVYSIPTMLTKHGYKPDRKGASFLCPTSTSGIHGVRLLGDGDKCYSHHGVSDPLADGRAHDAFDVFAILEHGGDVSRATAAGGSMLYLNGWQTITHYNRDIFRRHQQRVAAAANRTATARGAA